LGFIFLIIKCFKKNKFYIPYKNKIFIIIIIFLVWCLFSFLINYPDAQIHYYKKTSGVNRFIRQYFALILTVLFFFIFYINVLKNFTNTEIFLKIRRIFLFSFLIVSLYGILEILFIKFGFYPAYKVLKLFDYFPFTEYDTDISKRISSVTFEPPSLATYLIMISGWMFSYIKTNTSLLKYLPGLFVLILTYYSGSRTALIVIFIQVFVFLYLVLTKNQKKYLILFLSVFVLINVSLIAITNSDKIINDFEKKIESLDFKSNYKKNVSNQSRFGIQYANFKVFLDSPITGVGFGQQAFYAINYYPLWAKKNNYEFKYIYLNKNISSFPPGYNLYIRLLAETGMIGFLIFIYLLFLSFKQLKNVISSSNGNDKILGFILLTSLLGYSLNFLQLDTFRIFGFWLSIAILIRINNNKKVILNE